MVFDGGQFEKQGTSGRLVVKATGILSTRPRDWWIDGEDIANHPNWSGAASFCRPPKPKASGERWQPGDVDVIRELLHPVALHWWDTKSAEMKAKAVPLARRGRKKLPQHLTSYMAS